MTYSIEQVQRGITRYIDTEMLSKITGPSKWLIGAMSAMYVSKLPEIVDNFRQKPAISILGVLPEGGGMDVDALYVAIKPQADKCPITFDVPMLGSLSLSTQDVDNIYNAIRNS